MAAQQTRPAPEFDSVDEERLHRLQRLATACRLFSHSGFDEGAAGQHALTSVLDSPGARQNAVAESSF